MGKTPEEILNIKIADIACGSGIFLEEAFSFLIDYCTSWYKMNNINYLEYMGNQIYKLPFSDKKNILIKCIYGIDIDNHAVDVTKFSLALKLLENETIPSLHYEKAVLPSLSKNIKQGNSLVEFQDLDPKDDIDRYMEILPFDFQHKFNIILGNPPYVKTEDLYKTVSSYEVEIYKKKYKSAYKQFDKYFLFIERAIKLVDNDGIICYIIPNKFYKIPSGKKLRELITFNNYLNQLDDFGELQLFEDKTIYSAIIKLVKNNNNTFSYTGVKSASKLWTLDTQYNQKIILKSENLTSEPWLLSTDVKFLQKLETIFKNSTKLEKIVDIFNGIQTSAERPTPIYWFNQDEVISETKEVYHIKRDNNLYNIEKNILKPFFKPSNINEKGLNSYSSIFTNKFIIFPYNQDGSLIDIEKMKSKFPGTYEYLFHNYDRLVPKQIDSKGIRDVPTATSDTWYQYGRTQSLTKFFNKNKLIVGILSKEPMYALDTENMLIASGGTAGYCAVINKENSPYHLSYIQAWLTHPYIEKILRITGSDFENGFISRGTYQLNRLPFIELDFKNKRHKDLHDEVVIFSEKIYELNNKIAKLPKNSLKIVHLVFYKNELITKIKNLIEKVYNSEV